MSEDFSKDIAAIDSIKAVPTILDIVSRTAGMRFVAVARVTDNRWIACSVRDKIAFGLVPGGELAVETTICHEIRQTKKAVIIDDVAHDAEYRDHHTPAKYGFRSYISMPIHLMDGSFFGTLCAIDPEPHRLRTTETIEMFEMFADVIGYHLSTMDRLQLTEASLLGERSASALREQFIAVLGHDLRNPLAAVDGGLQMLAKTPLDQKAAKIVTMARSSVVRMAGLIDNIMDFARGRLGGGLTLDRKLGASIETMLRQVIAELEIAAPGRRIETHFALTEPVNCDLGRMGQLASNLLGNALTYGAPDTAIKVSATTDAGWFELSVANRGEPIPEAAMLSIFKPFSRGDVRPSLQGLGLGLYISSEIAKAHGATLDVTSSPAETRFTFRMSLGVS
jgi:signal transduction histidine kinase